MIRKHSGINQKNGKLKKGYKYSGKKLKSGLPQIVKIKKNKKNKQKGGEDDLELIKKEVVLLQKDLKSGGPKERPYTGIEKLQMRKEIRKLIKRYNSSIKVQDELNRDLATYPEAKTVVTNVAIKANEIKA